MSINSEKLSELQRRGKHITISHDDLHPEIRRRVDYVLGARKERLGSSSGVGLIGMPLLAIGGAFPTALAHSMWSFFTSLPFNVSPAKYLIPGAFVGGIAAADEYKQGSEKVRSSTEKVTERNPVPHLDKDGKVKINQIKQTHPFAFINRKGDVVLVPNTRYQRAIVKAQNTFLEGVLPARKRMEVK